MAFTQEMRDWIALRHEYTYHPSAIAEEFKQTFQNQLENISFGDARAIDIALEEGDALCSGPYWLTAYPHPNELGGVYYLEHNPNTGFGGFHYRVTRRGWLYTFDYEVVNPNHLPPADIWAVADAMAPQ